jgi:general secretion pathway protein A
VLCDRILLGAYGQGKLKADRQMLKIAAREVMGEEPRANAKSSWRARMPLVIIVMLLLGLGAGVAAGLLNGQLQQPQWMQTAWRQAVPAAASPEVKISADTALVTPEPLLPNQSPAWLLAPRSAMSEIWALASSFPVPENACSGEPQHNISCVVATAQTWDELQQFDRPLVLDMITPERFSASTLLLGVQGRSATVFTREGLVVVDLAMLGDKWTGSYRFLWQSPKGFSGPLAVGVSNATVSEVAQLFAQLDGQEEALASSVFNSALQRRVILFQQKYALEDDGVVGVQTLLKLNELLGIDANNSRAKALLQEKYTEAGS